jgi:hypothetical protein
MARVSEGHVRFHLVVDSRQKQTVQQAEATELIALVNR